MHRVPGLVLACVPALLVACYHPGVQPRTGEVARRGGPVTIGTLTPRTLAPGQVDDDTGQRFEGDFGERAKIGGLIELLAAPLTIGSLGAGVGVTDRLELGATLSFHQAEMELRLGVLGERWGDSLSVAVSAAGRYGFFPNVPGARTGVDLSKRFGRLIALGGLHASHGGARYAYKLSYDDCTRPDFGGAIARCSFLADRNETRLSATLGGAFDLPRTRNPKTVAIMVALVPYVVLDASEPTARCAACDPLATDTFEASWGVSLVLGMIVLP